MKKIIRSLRFLAPVADVLISPFTLLAALWFRLVRFWGVKNMRLTKSIFLRTGMFPIVDHYYEPLFDYRKLPGKGSNVFFNWNSDTQVEFIKQLNYSNELKTVDFKFNNGSFGPGDAELYYSIIRKNKPRRILEIGSGYSTLMCLEAVKQNLKDDPSYKCNVTCVEPYEMPFLDKLNIELIRKKIEDIDPSVFAGLQPNDILFIDSSHIIRPGGDVNYIILKILPSIPPGVWVHFHDIFLPNDYPTNWLRDEFRMWNEQYLLEAFLLNNNAYEIMISMNYLHHTASADLNAAFPILAAQSGGGSSFWIRRR